MCVFLYIHFDICICVSTCVCIKKIETKYIYIYIYNERERFKNIIIVRYLHIETYICPSLYKKYIDVFNFFHIYIIYLTSFKNIYVHICRNTHTLNIVLICCNIRI